MSKMKTPKRLLPEKPCEHKNAEALKSVRKDGPMIFYCNDCKRVLQKSEQRAK